MQLVQRRLLRNYVLVIGLALVPLGLFLNWAKSDVEFCRRALKELVYGQETAERRIDWTRFKAMDVDVAGTYKTFTNEKDRTAYRQLLMANIAKGFEAAKGNVGALKRWRVTRRGADQVVVAADSVMGKGLTLLCAVSASRPKKLLSLQWQR